jgi:hypothetical protein
MAVNAGASLVLGSPPTRQRSRRHGAGAEVNGTSGFRSPNGVLGEFFCLVAAAVVVRVVVVAVVVG